jgi:ApaG protein
VSVRFSRLTGLGATIDNVVYDPSLSAPPDRPHPFVYFVTIHNNSKDAVTIFGRKWIVDDSGCKGLIVVEGDGVIGKFPRIEPGTSFSYKSYHVVRADSRAVGSFFGSTDKGKNVCVKLPEFAMTPPGIA